MPPPAEPSAAAAGRREFLLVLLAGAAGGGLVLLALRQIWAHAVYTPPRPFPVQDVAISGQQLVPLAAGLAIAALACLAAVIATRGVVRRGVGVLLALIGAGAVGVAAAAVTSSAVLAAAAGGDPVAGAFGGGAGSTTSGSAPGSGGGVIAAGTPGHAVISGLPWHVVAVIGALAIVLAGLATAWRGPRWPVMSARYELNQAPRGRTDSATMWESLSRDVDPTDDAAAR